MAFGHSALAWFPLDGSIDATRIASTGGGVPPSGSGRTVATQTYLRGRRRMKGWIPTKRIYLDSVIVTRGTMLRRLVWSGVVGTLLVALFFSGLTPPIGPGSDDDSERRSAGICEAYYTATIQANVTSDIGRPIAGASVHLVGNGTWETNVSGVTTIPGLLADVNGTDYTLWAEMEGYVSSPPVMITVTPSNTTCVNLTIRGGVIIGIQPENWHGPLIIKIYTLV